MKIAVSLKELEYIDSAAVNVLIYARETLAKLDGEFCILEPNPYILNVLAVLGLTDLFVILADRDRLH